VSDLDDQGPTRFGDGLVGETLRPEICNAYTEMRSARTRIRKCRVPWSSDMIPNDFIHAVPREPRPYMAVSLDACEDARLSITYYRDFYLSVNWSSQAEAWTKAPPSRRANPAEPSPVAKEFLR
jgi:hypothetical protein